MSFADRTRRIHTSALLEVFLEAERQRRLGVDLVDLGAGEPDLPTPAHVKQAAVRAIEDDYTRYTPAAGAVELRAAVAARYRADYGVVVDEREVLITAGAKQALFNTALVLYQAGDEVITHQPGWPSIVEQIALTGATPVIVRTEASDGFALDPDRVIAAMTARTKAIVLNSPGNPTGALVSESALRRIVEAAAARGVWIVVDLCYDRLIYEDVPHNLPGVLAAHHRDRMVLAGSTSKTYAMTGWRCGWLVGPAALIAAANALQSHSTSNAASVSQRAALAALDGDQAAVTAMVETYRRRRDVLHEGLTRDPRVECVKPAGAFYLFPRVARVLEGRADTTSVWLARRLLEETGVVVSPGEAFGAPGHLRLSYAASTERLETGLARIGRFLAALDAVAG